MFDLPVVEEIKFVSSFWPCFVSNILFHLFIHSTITEFPRRGQALCFGSWEHEGGYDIASELRKFTVFDGRWGRGSDMATKYNIMK